MWTLIASVALATDSGIQRIYDRQVQCGYSVDPPAEASTCDVVVRSALPDDDRPTWAITVAAPGKMFYGMHMPNIDWGHVYRVDVPRSFDPVLLSPGITTDAQACPEERLFYIHSNSERGPLTKQVCAGFDWEGHGEVLLESHRKLTGDTWIPIWAWVPDDPEKAKDVNSWFIIQIYLSPSGKVPDRPEQHPYVSPEVVRAWVPKPLPMRKRLMLMGPEDEGSDTDE